MGGPTAAENWPENGQAFAKLPVDKRAWRRYNPLDAQQAPTAHQAASARLPDALDRTLETPPVSTSSLPARPVPGRSLVDRGVSDVAGQVRDALRHLHDPVSLQTHPLAALASGDRGGRAGSAGKALRQRLLDAVAALRPEAPAADARSWRRFRLLTLRYIEGMEIAEVCRQLAISQREYSRAHRQAVDALASLLLTGPDRLAPPPSDAARPAPIRNPPAPVAAPPDAAAEPPGRLPAPLSSFIGRERELATIAHLLASLRLVTLTGPPGAGKTRLALQAAIGCRACYADGVAFVPLAPIRDPALAAPAIAQALGVREAAHRPLLSSLRDHLAGKHLLLVLDNFEQVLDAAPMIADLLADCPRLAALVTSRAALRLTGEHEFAAPPLALPEHSQALAVADLARYEAIRLFVERAQAIQEDFALTAENAPAVAEICRRLDGLPLAIELAAARSRLLTPQGMLARLDRRLPLLTGGTRDLPARHQTLREAIAWSYHLLAAAEQQLFRQLVVFVDGFSLEAAEAVAREGGGDVLTGLESLIAKSLVRRLARADGESRFFLLQTLREYGEEQLAASGEAVALHRRHADYFVALAERAARDWPRPRGASWLDRLQQEHDNLRAALGWLLEQQEAEAGLRLATALAPFWEVRRFIGEGRRWLTALLGLPGAAPTPSRADALRWAGRFAAWQGEYAAARALAEEGLAVSRRLGYRAGVERALECLGGVALEQGDYGQARRLLEEALALHRARGDRGGSGRVLLSLGILACAERAVARAAACLEESLALARELGDERRIAATLTYLGHVACARGDYARARSLYEQNLALHRALHSDRYVTLPLWGLGNIALAQGDAATARSLYREALARAREQENRLEQAVFLLACGRAALAAGRHARAVRLLVAADALRAALASPWPPGDREDLDRSLAAARAALAEEDFAASRAEGQAIASDRAVADALAEDA